MAYEEINPTDWKPVEKEDFIEGVLIQVQKDVGVNDAMLYSIETPKKQSPEGEELGGVKSVWGAAILNSRMSFVKVGDKIKITYKGLAEAKAGKKPAKIFKVEVDKQVN